MIVEGIDVVLVGESHLELVLYLLEVRDQVALSRAATTCAHGLLFIILLNDKLGIDLSLWARVMNVN